MNNTQKVLKNQHICEQATPNLGITQSSGLEEQTVLIEYLDKVCADIDATVSIKSAQLEAMRKHKEALIYEYVTGKKRVKEVR